MLDICQDLPQFPRTVTKRLLAAVKKLGVCVMAKPATLQIKLVSTADTGYFYVTKKNPRTKPEKLELKKYDPRARKHVIFREAKIK